MFQLKLQNSKNYITNINDGKNYVVLNVTGLNPPSASLFTSKSPNRKGLKYNGSTLDERHIVITIKILGDIEINRNNLYEWIDSENYVKIYYRNGLKNVYCEGYVEECEVDFFSNNEIIDVAIVCPDPYWKDLVDISTDISSILKQFKLPFSISTPIPFSTIQTNNTTNIFNHGSETGVKIKINCLNDLPNLRIYNANDGSQQFKINTTLKQNWYIEIDTTTSPKTVKAYKPDGTIENLLKYVGKNPTWFTLKNGNNIFGFSTDGNVSDVEISISFTNKYLGV